jgi:iron complex outermembrane receptor protein
MKTDTQRFRRTVVSRAAITALWGTAAVLASQATLAQQQPSTTLQRVEVTGSNIKRTDTETASPVQVLTREDIEKTGRQTIQEVLRGITADGLGSIPTSFTNGFAAGSAAVSLRGLGVNSTLVLINGRRMAPYGLADDGTRNFVDLNSLPLEAVERVEVLKDGASAIYGADALGGVVNIILRKNYVGKSVGGSYGQTGHSDGQTTRAFGSIGFGNIDTDKYNVFMTLEASKQDNIWSKDRGFIGTSDLSAFNFYDVRNGQPRPWIGAGPTANSPYGVIRNPANNARVNVVQCDPSLRSSVTGLCLYDRLAEQEIQPKTDRINFFGRGTMEFSPTLTGYAELGLFNTVTKANGTLGAYNDGGVFKPGDPLNPLIVHGLIPLPATHPDNPYGVARPNMGLLPNELGGRDEKLDNTVTRIIAGLQGTAFGWDYDTGIGYMHNKLKDTRTGYINYDAFVAAVNNGTYRFSGLGPNRTPANVQATYSYPLVIEPTSTIKLIDFKANRELMNLPGGPMGIAVGAEYRKEDSNTPPVPGTDTGSIVGLGYSAYTASRKVYAVFGELNAPVTKWLELNGAVRYDHYNDFGSSTTPKVGFKLKPMDQIALRGTYAESFRAPGAAEVGGSSFGFTSVGILSQGNPNIKPEKAKSYTLGIIAEPWAGTSATLDYYKIKRKDEIVQADPALIIPPGTPLTAAPFTKLPGAQPNSFIYYDSTGQLATVTGFYMNASSTKTDGIDLELKHRMNLGSVGKLTAQLNWSHVNSLKRTDPFGNTLEYAGTHGPIVQSSGAGNPKDRASFSLTLDRGPWTVTGMLNYVGPIKLVDHVGETAADNGDGTVTDVANGLIWNWDGTSSRQCGVFTLTGQPYNGCKLPSFTTFDLYAKWTPIKNLDINFSVQNVFDRKAPFDPYLVLSYGINYNQGWHQAGALGRFFTVGARYTF